MMYVFAIVSPGSDLHEEPIEIEDIDKVSAEARARCRVDDTFSIASAARKAITTIRFIAEYPSRRAMEEATSWAAE